MFSSKQQMRLYMTIAQDIKEQSKSFEQVLEVSEQKAIDAEQDWENRETLFKFADGSQLKAKYPEVKVM
jgi:hypothetical protein